MADVMGAAADACAYAGAADIPSIDAPRELVAVEDGEEVFGLRIVATPGHTAGHIAVFDPDSGLLVAGDALSNTAGLAGSPPQFTADGAQAEASVRKLADLDVQRIRFGHGDPLEEGAATALRTWPLRSRPVSALERAPLDGIGWHEVAR